jgi:circadian clock protein KaiB
MTRNAPPVPGSDGRGPQGSVEWEILALPALVRTLPEPLRTLIGDLSSVERILIGLDLQPLGGGKT